jgi:hypothetical protein
MGAVDLEQDAIGKDPRLPLPPREELGFASAPKLRMELVTWSGYRPWAKLPGRRARYRFTSFSSASTDGKIF